MPKSPAAGAQRAGARRAGRIYPVPSSACFPSIQTCLLLPAGMHFPIHSGSRSGAKPLWGEDFAFSSRALLCVAESSCCSVLRQQMRTEMSSSCRGTPSWRVLSWGFGFCPACAGSAQQAVTSPKCQQLASEEATVSKSLNAFLESSAVLAPAFLVL